MKKSTIKVSWDTLQQINRLALDLSEKRNFKVTQDQVIRYLFQELNKGGKKDERKN
jgi:hypothetical protein